MFEKIWRRHVVVDRDDGYALIYIDRHLMHDGSGAGFARLRERGLPLRRSDRAAATPDHYVPSRAGPQTDPHFAQTLEQMRRNTAAAHVTMFGLGDIRQGIAHVVGPEQGLTQPGLTLVCGDSHTSTHGALGALAFGIGSSEVFHVMATQCLWQRKPKAMRISVEGSLASGVTAKDVILAIIAKIGAAGAVGHVVEYAGSAIRSLSIEGRLTVCNMSIEAGARAGMIAPDDTTIAYLQGRPFAPAGENWDKAVAFWRSLRSDEEATFDREVTLKAEDIAPMVTWGTSPEDALPITGRIPDPASESDTLRKEAMRRALDYMGLVPGTPLQELAVDHVFIGSCTNSRIEDLRAAASVVKGRKARVSSWVVAGSGLIKQQAEAEGINKIFQDAGFEWREPGCSMCVGMNGDIGQPGQRIASTSNRNFVGRQGRGVRTHLMSPAMAAAAAICGHFSDVRRLTA
ncbi:3-isopropylmalate dehydratase large subunit [Bradyrhizobium sp. LHD-71]|uniref:3-isopropylmalate dehydratase large subunit n=1 Tax=Bradyrhizobium sp. LHD-71 TaxID=3072141 RepID=UPI00280DFFA7|nr:3-isopropylmalate dehydratase large subunit [Bradyrhizobium sp. LHD-71]MDQ8728480.1 3-isopropylmalate dehydratase large subunit [Bradyrhizobium sp. LHD-71]